MIIASTHTHTHTHNWQNSVNTHDLWIKRAEALWPPGVALCHTELGCRGQERKRRRGGGPTKHTARYVMITDNSQ